MQGAVSFDDHAAAVADGPSTTRPARHGQRMLAAIDEQQQDRHGLLGDGLP